MRNHHWYLFVSVVCFFLGLQAVAAQATELKGTIEGLESDGKYNAFVRFNGPARYSATTDAHGKFRIKAFEEGDYTITVQQGSHRQIFIYEISPDKPLDLKVPW